MMDHRVDLYIPSQCICTGRLPEAIRNRVIEEVIDNFDKWFGSHSEILIKGDWTLPDGTKTKEESLDIYSFCTGEALEQHQGDVDQLAVGVANRLTQDHVLRVFDNLKVAFWPNTLENLKPKKNCACYGGAKVGVGITAQPTEIGRADRLTKMLVIQGILRSFKSTDHVRKLFCDVLNYHYATGELPCAKWPDSIRSMLTGAPTILADHNGFKILYLRISADELRRGAGRQVIQRIWKDDPTFRGLIVVSNQLQTNWELLNVKVHGDDTGRLVLRRMRVGVDGVRTATERMATLEITEVEETSVEAEELQSRHDKAFDVEGVTRAFFADIANWYFWALKHVRFPKDAPKEKDGHDHVSVIRLITRLIFCWFVKEKGLIPAGLFDEHKLGDLLVGFAPNKVSKKGSVFYKAILQNLFFATLNTEMDNRGWRRNGQNFMAHSLYRHKTLFVRPDEALVLFKNIPFLNGGLFECLDKDLGEKVQPRYVRVDGFSDREDSQPTVPDFLFFGEEREHDLSEEYGDEKFNKVMVRGLIHTLNHYRFTIEESTPLEEEVALDPELAGKIFENLLAAYNPETGATARKQTGSFYTPREIVNYMVDEALIGYLKGKLVEVFPKAPDIEPRLRHLYSYEEEKHRFTTDEVKVLIASVDQLKVLDPAVGSGAFPMGILHKLVFILGRLDPRNEMWKERQKQRLQEAIATAVRIEEATMRDLQQQLAGIDEAFEKNTLDYGRKLYLIENCLYGVDIQPIAVQIAKMRFFISLIADQKVDPAAENIGVRPLPNLETKLVAADTLIGIDKPKQMMFRNPHIDALEGELRRVRERSFYARTPASKGRSREVDKNLRLEIAGLLKKDGWGDKTAKQLAAWDPYDQNAWSEFFDPEWMFGVKEGVNVVIGNPPWGVKPHHVETLKEELRINKNLDSAEYFLLKSFTFLRRENGILSFIVPKSIIFANNWSISRDFILEKDLLSLADAGISFEAVNLESCVIIVRNCSYKAPNSVRIAKFEPLKRFSSTKQLVYLRPIEQEMMRNVSTLIAADISEGTYGILQKIQNTRKFLGHYRREVFRGLYLPDHLKEQILDKGKSLFVNKVPDVDLYSINKIRKVDLSKCRKEYSAIIQRLSQDRIIVKVLRGRRLTCAWAPKEVLTTEKLVNLIVDQNQLSPFYVLGMLNSKLTSFYLAKVVFSDTTETSRVMDDCYLSKVPIKEITQEAQRPIITLVKKILSIKKDDPAADTTSLEREIDQLVYGLYGLTPDEIKIVEGGR